MTGSVPARRARSRSSMTNPRITTISSNRPKRCGCRKGGNEANATDAKIMVSGHGARGIYVNNPTANVGYRNNATKGRAKNDEPEAMYMVVDATRFSTIWQCAVRGPADEVERQRPAGYSPMKKRGA